MGAMQSAIVLPAPPRIVVPQIVVPPLRLPKWAKPWEKTKEDALTEAIAFRTPTFADYETATRSPSVTKPTGTVDGDFVLVGSATDTVHVMTPPAGWTLVGSIDQGTDTTFSAFYKIASGEPSSWTFTNLFSTTEVGTTFALAASGVDQTTPLDGVVPVTLASAAANAQNWTALTPNTANAIVLGIGGSDPSSSGRAATPNATWTELLDHLETPNGINGWVYALYKQLVAASSQTPGITIDGGGSNTMAKITLVLRTATVGATATTPKRQSSSEVTQRAEVW